MNDNKEENMIFDVKDPPQENPKHQVRTVDPALRVTQSSECTQKRIDQTPGQDAKKERIKNNKNNYDKTTVPGCRILNPSMCSESIEVDHHAVIQ